MLGVGLTGLLINLAAAWVLKRSAGESLNVQGAFLHVMGDLLGSIGVVVGGLLIIAFGWSIADPIFGVIIGSLILLSSGRLLWQVLHVLMEGTPSRLDLQRLCRRLEQVEGVTGVHDIHAWSITTGYEVLSAHVTANLAAIDNPGYILQHLRDIASGEFGINHVTIQLEDSPPGVRGGPPHRSYHRAGPADGRTAGRSLAYASHLATRTGRAFGTKRADCCGNYTRLCPSCRGPGPIAGAGPGR